MAMPPTPNKPDPKKTVPTAKGVAPGKTPAKPAPKKPVEKPNAAPKGGWSGSEAGTRKFGQVLVDLGFLDEAQLDELMFEVRSSEMPLEQLALDRGLINSEQILQAKAEQHGLKVVNLDEAKPTPEALKLVPENMAQVYKVLPLSFEGDTLTVVMNDPGNLAALDDLRNFLGVKSVTAVLAPQYQIDEHTKEAYTGKPQESIVDLLASLEDTGGKGRQRETSIDLGDLMEIADSAPVRKLINMILLTAIRDRASDIHFEPFEEEYKVRARCDGVLMELIPPPRHLERAISSRIKVMSNLDIAERRMPQDGRIELNVGGNQIDLRVSILPTMFGESVVIRVLDRTVVNLDLDRLGMDPAVLVPFRELIHKPNGIVLVTGPTGAGKTTTLYSALNELNQITEKIITTEDPVEYEIDGIVQCQIHHEIDLTFASALRSILRQDPDIILVGEIRDLETAQIAVQASLTGHMVFSTLHTNDASSTITRMRDMGVEPFLITATVEGIIAQRLVRKICNNCRQEYDPGPEQLMELNITAKDLAGRKFFYGAGCDKCNNLGFKGRCGLYEMIVMDDDLRDMISSGASTDLLRKASRDKGFATLRDAGLAALYGGVTTLDEVVRETVLEDEA
ncbi:MAG: Flp pilus assembly complex ATPase component TadA [Gemmataceae bacterium]|nr:Flp pilus assembly complex ATPase component TadA [Gemmataceae bacterium]